MVAAPPSAMMVAAAAIGRVRVRLVQVSSVVAVIPWRSFCGVWLASRRPLWRAIGSIQRWPGLVGPINFPRYRADVDPPPWAVMIPLAPHVPAKWVPVRRQGHAPRKTLRSVPSGRDLAPVAELVDAA